MMMMKKKEKPQSTYEVIYMPVSLKLYIFSGLESSKHKKWVVEVVVFLVHMDVVVHGIIAVVIVVIVVVVVVIVVVVVVVTAVMTDVHTTPILIIQTKKKKKKKK
jgi:Flp pilus assembly protein TadB